VKIGLDKAIRDNYIVVAVKTGVSKNSGIFEIGNF
jgi:hypothetical protein